MMPPRCEVCDLAFDPGLGGDSVAFADLEDLPEGMTGQPEGLAWFCRRHLEAARSLRHLELADACRRLRAGSGGES